MYIRCSGGTYIRSLIRDIGKKLTEYYKKPVPCMMWELVRTNSNGFSIDNSYELKEIEEMIKRKDYSFIIPPEEVFRNYLTLIYPKEHIIKGQLSTKIINVYSDLIQRNIGKLITLRDNNYKIWSICEIKSSNKLSIIWQK